jgi:hypothetical protein
MTFAGRLWRLAFWWRRETSGSGARSAIAVSCSKTYPITEDAHPRPRQSAMFGNFSVLGIRPVVAQKPIRSQRMLIRDRVCPFSESGHRDFQNRESQ